MTCTEETLMLGESRHLICTFVTPERIPGQTPAVVALLTNSGVIPRAGPNRMNVHLSQQFAAMGIPSVRFDLSGLGDSGRPSQPKPMMTQWIEDCQSVMDHAQKQYGCMQFLMIGFCSGAEVAHLLALQDARMRAALLWDMYAYPTTTSRLRFQLFRLQRLGLHGLIQKISSRLSRRLGQAQAHAKPARPAAIPANPPSKTELVDRLNTLTAQGVILHFSFGEGNPHWFNHAQQFWDMFRGEPFLRRVSFHFLQEADHLMTSAKAQTAFLSMTSAWVRDHVLPKLTQPATDQH